MASGNETRMSHETLAQLRAGRLAGVRRLDLCAGLTEFPREILDLADTLEVLNLSGNRLASLPDDLGRLHRLRVLFCSDNAFTRLPSCLGDCEALEMVGFKANRIADVPAQALPTRLRWLILTDNAITVLPGALGERPALQKLMLAGNRLTALPDTLSQASALELLRLSANALTQLPGWLPALPRLSWLALAGNPLGWQRQAPARLPAVQWEHLRVGDLLGSGASGEIHRVYRAGMPAGEEALALKLFKGAVTSDGLPQDEMAACVQAGAHPALTTPLAVIEGHPQGTLGLLMPLIPDAHVNLADPPSFDSCTRDVYADGQRINPEAAWQLLSSMAHALAWLHARGVMHGDFYAHNILWRPDTGQALLGDFGAATVLPQPCAGPASELLALEVRAFGCLVEEVVQRCDGFEQSRRELLSALMAACLQTDPARRPTMADMADKLR